MRPFLFLALVSVFAVAATSPAQGLGKSRGQQGKQEQGKSTGNGSTTSSGSSQGGLGKSQGGGSTGSTGSQGGGSSSGLGKGQGGGNSGGSSSGGGFGRSQGGNSSSGGYGSGTTQGRSQGGDLGRIDSGSLNRTNSLGKGSDQGRSGASGYGSNNNRGRSNPFSIDRPELNLNKGSLPSQVFRTETIRVNSRWRDGYCAYNDSWRDDYFYYPYYTFSPWSANRDCTVSPWYYYPNLPGYILTSRIRYYGNTRCDWGIGTIYTWSRGNNGYGYGWGNDSRYDRDLDQAIGDIESVFERNDRRALGRLVPRSGRVNIYMDSVYCYSLYADDFYDLMLDNALSTRTIRYSINRVTTYRDSAQVSASHEFLDPWGRRQVVYHHYRLERDRYDYVITDFLTSGRP